MAKTNGTRQKKNKIKEIQFPEIKEESFSGCSIIDDFEIFIEYAQNKGIELSKSGVISTQDCKTINSMLASKIIVPFSRPLPKSYPNVINLFILFRISGVGELTTNGKKSILRVNPELFSQWKNFSIYEKYFNLLALTLDHYSFEFVNEGSRSISFTLKNVINEILNKKRILFTKQRNYYFESFDYKCIWLLYSQFGLVDVDYFEPEEGKKTVIESIKITNWGSILFPALIADESPFYGYSLYNLNENEDHFKTIFIKAIPQVKKSFTLPDIDKIEGIYSFNVKLGRALRKINIDSSNDLDTLCCFVLECFDFDYDHMYMVTLKDRFGRKIEFNGCPDISFAESPTTEDITIGELPIQPGSKMEYIYDFGDYWQFEILLESILPRQKNKKLKEPELIKSTGQAPNQYGWDNDDVD